MTCRIENGVTYSQAYNAENRISSIAKRSGDCTTGTILESWSFAYDGDGVRVMTAHFTGTSGTPDSTTSYYMGSAYEVKDSAVKKYYSIAGMMVAVKEGSDVQYLLTDHLGSTVAVTNSSGTLTSQQRYLPFGAPRAIPNSPILATDFTYTGQRKLAPADGMGGIMDYKARFYSPALGRFLQPDSIIPNPVNPQAYNRYSYGLNNPSRYTDPTGHFTRDEIISFFGVDTWQQVLVIFDNGKLRDRWGWLLVLQTAEIGDRVSVTSKGKSITGNFDLDPSGDLIIVFTENNYFVDQEKVGLLGDSFELTAVLDLTDYLCSPYRCTLEYSKFATDAVIPVPPYMNNMPSNPNHKPIWEEILEELFEEYDVPDPDAGLPSGNYGGSGGSGGSPIDVLLVD